MHFLGACLFFLLAGAPGCSSLSTKAESIKNTVNRLHIIAQITLLHVKKLRTELPPAPQIKLSTPSIQGLTSISHDLGLLTDELQSIFTEPSQIQTDVSSLEGLVGHLARTMDCPIQAKPQGPTGDALFPHTQVYVTLTKVQLYLDSFLLHKDKLMVC
ncbi:leptin-B-like [Notolabrus celidotus]|uniref:leptin-B-like n=1 Tax=Notolabrus celidotus TaxID=1203425 RepID=UPI00149023CD|nr:leptin-B-like [Notolabrus celidotus]